MKNRISSLTLAVSTACYSFASVAADNAGLIGQLTNNSQDRVFAGAKIEITELGKETFSARDGTFRFNNLPAGQFTLVVTYLGAEPVSRKITLTEGKNITPVITLESASDTLEEVMVRGQRGGQASAINQQRMADNIKSIVSADAIGQFPDQNAAESLQRLPGLSIERDQGEGRFVSIRGIDPNLNNVTINGLNVPSPEGGVRSVTLDVIPSELIQTLEVSKSVTSDMDGDAIGGSIAVKSVSAFDRKGQTASVSGQLSQNELRDEVSPKVSGTYTNLWKDTFGVAAALSYLKRDFGSDNIESNADDEIEQRHYTITRERLGAAVNFDYRPDFNNSYYLRTLYSEFSDEEYRQRNTFVFDDEDSEVERQSKDRYEEQSILTIAVGGEHVRDEWTFDYQLGYAKSDEDEPDALYYNFIIENDSIESDMQQVIPSIVYPESVNDFNNYEVDEISFEDNYAEDTEKSIKANLSKAFAQNTYLTEIKTGIKYRTRTKTVDSNIYNYDGDFDNTDPTRFAAGDVDWGLGNFGPGLNRGEMRSYFDQNRGALELADLDSELESNGASYQTNEDIFAAYLMSTFDINDLHIVAGVRYEKTDFDTTGMRVELIEDEQNDTEEVANTVWQSERNYNHFLPSINVKYTISDKLIFRGAYTQTIARPGFEESAAFQIIESKTEEDDGAFVTEREAEVGNPQLQPYESDNFDLSVEYYPGQIGVLSAGLFYKQIDNFVVYADVAGMQGWEGFDEVIQPRNGEDADLSGVELSWVKVFDNGLLLSANGTFSSSDATTLLDGEEYKTSLPNQSDTVGNLTVGYEDNDWSLRLAMNYKSKNLDEIDGDMLRMEDAHQQLDFMGKYYINQDLTVYFNAININDEPYYHYFDRRDQNAQYEEYGRTFEIGFNWQL
ncbi:TonB-dependent receptor [Salinimonas sp. HHU 13199]|uniref:TonB-dependent receptor n=1 Tax=Salinimonas profundi TaxID=2729140 RepID=A0ABR8LNU0_9ALTE|nr:TonB-dependent receptor [Salinimonas profundi]MBD3585609.1 TonB-dependent receptor [Salinimonas profundi]